MIVIGLTGSIGSGKSTVAAMLRNANIPVIDADELAREVTIKSSKTLAEIVQQFGSKLLLHDGSLDRKALGKLVFHNKKALATLESILHPAIEALRLKKLDTLAQEGHAVAVYIAPLLIEKGIHKNVDKVLLIQAKKDTLIERLEKREGLSKAESERRIALFMSDSEKAANAHEIIENDGSLEDLYKNLAKAWQSLVNSELPQKDKPVNLHKSEV
jgi:dephospho-CoA kinase